MPSNLQSLGFAAFNLCENLVTIELPESLTDIESHSFAFTGLTELIIPESVNYIAAKAFYGSENLTRLIINGWWYMTQSLRPINGRSLYLGDPSVNAGYFVNIYYNYNWYKGIENT